MLTVSSATSIPRRKPDGEVSELAKQLRSATRSPRVKELHNKIANSAHCSNVFLANLVVQSYGKCGNLAEARLAFDRIGQPNVFSWTIMLQAIVQHGDLNEARTLFETMPRRDPVSWVVMIRAYASHGKLDQAYHLFTLMPGKNVIAWTVILTAYAEAGHLEKAKSLFDEMPEKNHVAWGALISGYVKHGYLNEAKALFITMKNPTTFVYTSMVAAFAKAGEIDNAEKLYNTMPDKDVVAQTTMLQGFAHSNRLDRARKVFDSIPDKDVTAWNTMITAYAQNGQVLRAKEVFDSMPAVKRNIVTYNTMLSGFNLNGLPDRSLSLLQTMKIDARPNEITFVAALTACADIVDLHTGRSLHGEIVERALHLDGRIQASLINMYGKCHSLADAVAVFDRSWGHLRDDVVCWTAMITAFADNHRCREAIQALARMDLQGVETNPVTFVGLANGITVLPQAELVYSEIFQAGFHSRKLDTALIHMFSRCGSALAAETIFARVPPLYRDVASFDAMVSAYAKGGEFSAAVWIFRVMLLEGVAAVDEIVFVTVLSVCSHAGMLVTAIELFMSMRQDFGLEPRVDHFVCLVDLLGRSGQVHLAQELVQAMPFDAGAVPWTILVDSWKKVREGGRELASAAMEKTLHLDPEASASYILSSSCSISSPPLFQQRQQ